jgi:signal transduction histidine kinase/ligand-binding sensor domain-containing protein
MRSLPASRGARHLPLAALLTVAGPALALEPAGDHPIRSWPRVEQAAAVRTLLLARSGYLWIGTSEGLVRFDGQSMVSFDRKRVPGIVEGNIERVLEASDGALWVASQQQGLSRISGGEAVTLSVAQGLPRELVRGFAEAPDGALWAATFAGVVRFARGSLRPELVSEGLADRRVDTIAVDAAGVPWVGTRGGLARWDAGTKRWRPELGPLASPIRVQALLPAPDGGLLVGSYGGGVWERRGAGWRAFTTSEGLPSNDVWALLRERGGRLWVATRDGGLAWRDGDRFRRLPLPLGTCDQNIETLAEDDEGGLWIATEFCGLHRLQDPPIRSLSRRDGLPLDSVLGLTGGADGTVFLGTRGGGMARIAAGQTSATPILCGDLPCASCWDIAPEGSGFWAVCSDRTLLRWDGRAMSRPPLPAELDAVEMVARARDGALWLAREGTVVRVRGKETTRIPAQESLRGKRVLYEGPTGTMWIAGDDGVVAWRDVAGLLTRFPGPELGREVSNLYEDRAGTLWIGTKGSGLHVVRRGRAAHIDVTHGLPSGWIVQILDDDQGRLWLTSGKGIFSVDKRELEEVADGRRPRVHASLYDGNDGVLMRTDSFGHPAGWKGRDGRLWFATLGGAAVVDPPRARARAPRVVIEEVRVGGQRVETTATTLGIGPRDLQVRYTAPGFASEPSFRYRLDGKDTDWVDAGTTRSLLYPRLEAGRYELHVQARYRDGSWGPDGARLSFALRPPFYRSWWFLAGTAAALALLLALAHRLRLSQARAGLHAVMAERARIARDIHDTLAQAFVATSVQLECLDQALEDGDRSTIARHLENARRMVRESLDEARRSVWVLRPRALDRGLPAALEALAGGASGETEVDLEVVGTPRALPPLVEANLLRLAQEAVANAYRHARAQRIVVQLCYEPRRVRLSVTDDGMGVELTGPTSERGLAGMKERAAEVGGELFVERRPEGGTEVRAEVPA